MIIQADTRQKRKHHVLKEKYFEEKGIKVVNSKMLVGDYCIPSKGNICVDTKADISELYGNLIQQHDRFKRECILAQEAGIQLVVLIENTQGIKDMSEVINKWKNPQYIRYLSMRKKNPNMKQKPPASNVQLVKIMYSMSKKYGVKFEFCNPHDAGRRVVEILVETPCYEQKET